MLKICWLKFYIKCLVERHNRWTYDPEPVKICQPGRLASCFSSFSATNRSFELVKYTDCGSVTGPGKGR